MEMVKKSRKTNRTTDEMRDDLNRKLAFHNMHIVQINKRLEDLDKPRQPRKTRVGYNTALKKVKEAGITPEEIMRIIEERKEAAIV